VYVILNSESRNIWYDSTEGQRLIHGNTTQRSVDVAYVHAPNIIQVRHLRVWIMIRASQRTTALFGCW
jgi:hypothetical protein